MGAGISWMLWGLALADPSASLAAPGYAPTLDGPPRQLAPHEHEHDHDHGPPGALQADGQPLRAGPPLQIPWGCGQTEYCTQGHNGGSHTGTSAWAWDFSHTLGEEIWAASAGVVTHLRMNSNAGGCSTTYSSDANYITVDHGDGTSIVYLHMQANSSPLQVGDTVEVGDLVARVGETGYACGAHLHMQVQNTCGSYYCQSVSASFADYGDPSASTQYESTNCPSCPISLDGTQTVVDDEDAGCLVRQTTAWWSSYQGHSDHHFYTIAIDGGASESSARWRFGVAVPGDYLTEVFVPDADANSVNARYQVHHAGGVDEVAIDQNAQKGWQTLGVFEFVGGDEYIELGDATGEASDLGRRVGFDAVRFTYVPAGGETGADGSSTGDPGGLDTGPGADTGGGGETGGGGGFDSGGGDAGPGGDPGGTAGDETSPGLPPGFGEGSAPGGCACVTAPRQPGDRGSPGSNGAGWLALVVLAWRRRARSRGPR